MAKDLKYSTGAKNAKLGAIGLNSYIGGGALLSFYDGTKPASADTALAASNHLLCQLVCNAATFGAVANGVLTAGAITAGTGKAAAGAGTTATFFRLTQANGTTVICDGTVGITDGNFDLELDNPNIAQNQNVSLSSFTIISGN